MAFHKRSDTFIPPNAPGGARYNTAAARQAALPPPASSSSPSSSAVAGADVDGASDGATAGPADRAAKASWSPTSSTKSSINSAESRLKQIASRLANVESRRKSMRGGTGPMGVTAVDVVNAFQQPVKQRRRSLGLSDIRKMQQSKNKKLSSETPSLVAGERSRRSAIDVRAPTRKQKSPATLDLEAAKARLEAAKRASAAAAAAGPNTDFRDLTKTSSTESPTPVKKQQNARSEPSPSQNRRLAALNRARQARKELGARGGGAAEEGHPNAAKRRTQAPAPKHASSFRRGTFFGTYTDSDARPAALKIKVRGFKGNPTGKGSSSTLRPKPSMHDIAASDYGGNLRYSDYVDQFVEESNGDDSDGDGNERELHREASVNAGLGKPSLKQTQSWAVRGVIPAHRRRASQAAHAGTTPAALRRLRSGSFTKVEGLSEAENEALRKKTLLAQKRAEDGWNRKRRSSLQKKKKKKNNPVEPKGSSASLQSSSSAEAVDADDQDSLSEHAIDKILDEIGQFVAAGRTLYGTVIRTMPDLFNAIDKDGAGSISIRDLAAALRRWDVFGRGPRATRQIELLLKYFDANGDGKLGQPEFLRAMTPHRVQRARAERAEKEGKRKQKTSQQSLHRTGSSSSRHDTSKRTLKVRTAATGSQTFQERQARLLELSSPSQTPHQESKADRDRRALREARDDGAAAVDSALMSARHGGRRKAAGGQGARQTDELRSNEIKRAPESPGINSRLESLEQELARQKMMYAKLQRAHESTQGQLHLAQAHIADLEAAAGSGTGASEAASRANRQLRAQLAREQGSHASAMEDASRRHQEEKENMRRGFNAKLEETVGEHTKTVVRLREEREESDALIEQLEQSRRDQMDELSRLRASWLRAQEQAREDARQEGVQAAASAAEVAAEQATAAAETRAAELWEARLAAAERVHTHETEGLRDEIEVLKTASATAQARYASGRARADAEWEKERVRNVQDREAARQALERCQQERDMVVRQVEELRSGASETTSKATNEARQARDALRTAREERDAAVQQLEEERIEASETSAMVDALESTLAETNALLEEETEARVAAEEGAAEARLEAQNARIGGADAQATADAARHAAEEAHAKEIADLESRHQELMATVRLVSARNKRFAVLITSRQNDSLTPTNLPAYTGPRYRDRAVGRESVACGTVAARSRRPGACSAGS